MTYLTSTNESAIVAANNKISENCHLPNSSGTLSWGSVKKAVNQDLWFIEMPPMEGWGNQQYFSLVDMMNGVDFTDIIEQERDERWFPPPVSIV